ncbi:MAG: oligoendopeptidase F [Caloramator sp.]|nr:oligoendopeptidase F [Caloramator sp.]
MDKIMERKQIPEKFKWDIDTIYKDKEEVLKEIESIREKLEKIIKFKGILTESAENLYKCLCLTDEAGIACDRVYVYTAMKRDEDNSNPLGQELSDIGSKIYVEFKSASSFISPEIIMAGSNKINEFPKLKIYEHYFDNILRQQKHFLSSNEEKIVMESEEMAFGFENIFKMLNFVDLKFPKIKDRLGNEYELTTSNFNKYQQSKDRVLRKNAFEALYTSYGEFKNTYGALYSSAVKRDIFYAKVRGFESSLEASLFSDNVSKTIYHNVINTVSENINLLDRYCRMKKQLLNIEDLHLYDLYTPNVENVDMEVEFDNAKEMVLEVLSILGEEYSLILKEAFDDRWIDIYENSGKYSGAYSSGSHDTKPYILLNYKNKITDVLTLAHELGHSVHSYLSRKNQPYVYSNYTIFCAEVASTTNECLMYLYLMNKLKDDARKYIINSFLETIRTTYYRQTMFAEYELIAHDIAEKGEALNGDKLCNIWMKLYEKYYGRECIIDEKIKMEWARIPHFYDAFYVYKYVTGLSAGISIAKSIIEDRKNLERYFEFLKSGGSKYSLDLLKNAGVDMFSKKPIEDTAFMFKYLLDEMQK